jgi:hypothetical protein
MGFIHSSNSPESGGADLGGESKDPDILYVSFRLLPACSRPGNHNEEAA